MNSFLLLVASVCLLGYGNAQLNPNSTQIVNKLNEVRSNPSAFATKMQTNYSTFAYNRWIVQSFIKNETYNYTFVTTEGYIAFQEAVTALSQSTSAPNLTYSSGLSSIGQFDVNAYNNRSTWLSTPYGVCDRDVGQRVSEAGTYKLIDQSIVGGINEAELMVVAMLIGDGDQYRRARAAILNPEYTDVGYGQANLTTVAPIYNFIWAKNFTCKNTCPNIPPTNDSYDCSLPMPFTYGGGALLSPFIGLLLVFLLVVFAKF